MTLQAWHYENECPECGKNWGEHRVGHSASKCKMGVPAPPNKLQEAIEEVKQSAPDNWDWRRYPQECLTDGEWKAIATILNAVVKGELK